MKIAVVGLGLIGGSLCKAIHARTEHQCYGIDTDPDTLTAAMQDKSIVEAIPPTKLSDMDMTVVCLHPKQTISFLLEHKDRFAKNSIVLDVCGIKTELTKAVSAQLAACNVTFLGCHPMAGREYSGFAYAQETLFDDASFLMTPTEDTPKEAVALVEDLMRRVGFAKIVHTTPEEHDRVIAFTSQLAHVVSNAYMKSPTAAQEYGFSAGSYLDLTRVAKLNASMWTDLFLMNREPLLYELQVLIDHLQQYVTAMQTQDHERLFALLEEGSRLKEQNMQMRAKWEQV